MDMGTNSFRLALALLGIWVSVAPVGAQELQPLLLPRPRTDGGRPLQQALSHRQTNRDIRPDRLGEQVLADLLWSAFGINRRGTGQRTAPSAMDAQEIDVFVALPEGLYLYDAKTNALRPIVAEDLRSLTGGQDFAKTAPVSLIFVADLSRLNKAEPEKRHFYATFDAGCICQDVYLFCASEGPATVVHELDRGPLQKAMKLGPDQRIIMAQAVGFAKR
jgi:hypothetical protein